MDSVEEIEFALVVGIYLVSGLFTAILGIVALVLSQKMKKEGKKDHKTWFYISIVCFSIGGLLLIGAGFFGFLDYISALPFD